MIYSILLLILLSLFLLIRNYRNRYSWLFALMLLSLGTAFLGLIMNIVKIGNYYYPSHQLYELDYQFYLYLNRWEINYYDTIRLQLVGIALYLVSIPSFTLEFIRSRNRSKADKWVWTGLLSLLPIVYILFYDPNTSYTFYVLIHSQPERAAWLAMLLRVVDILNLCWIFIYLFYPLRLLYKHYKSSSISFRRKQILALSICLFIMNGLFITIFILSPNNQLFLFSNSEQLLKLSTKPIPVFYYQFFPLLMLLAVQVMIVILIRFRGIDTTMMFKNRLINRNVHALNHNLKGVFHSFKNTIFTVKILTEQVQHNYGSEVGMKAVERLQTISESSLAQLSKVIEAIRDIKVRPSLTSLVQVMEDAIERAAIDSSIHIEKRYLKFSAYSYIDGYHMTEALANVLKNAAEAIQAVNRDKGEIHIKVEVEYEWASISITDNGMGVSKKTKKQMFNAFFSSKSKHENWGIGLSYTYRIVKAHLGFIVVDSDAVSYTTITIVLPVDVGAAYDTEKTTGRLGAI